MICQLILQILSGELKNTHLISVDEKTGIQALSRKTADVPMKKGKDRRLETEYTRNGTTCLMAAFDVGKANILHHWINPTRKESDFLYFIQQCNQKKI